MSNKKIKITNGFHNMLIGYTGGMFSYSYQTHCMIREEKIRKFGNTNDGFDKKTVYIELDEMFRKDLLITMNEVLDNNDNLTHVKIANNMIGQLKNIDELGV